MVFVEHDAPQVIFFAARCHMQPPIPHEAGVPKPVDAGQEHDRLSLSAHASSVLTKNLGPFGASVALITLTAFASIELAKTDTAAIVIGGVALAAIVAVSIRSLSAR
jgi:hypothetical protein